MYTELLNLANGEIERVKQYLKDNETIRALIEKYKIPENDVITIKNTIYAL